MDAVLRLVLSLASIVAAEAPRYQCGFEARAAVVHVAMNRLGQPWVADVTQGWHTRPPVAADIADTLLALAQPDTTAGALFMFGPGDIPSLRQRNGGNLPWWLRRYRPYKRWSCKGTYVEAWSLQRKEAERMSQVNQVKWKLAVVETIKACGQTPIEAALSFAQQEYGPDAAVELLLLDGDHPLADLGLYEMTVAAKNGVARYFLSPPWATLRLSGCYRILELRAVEELGTDE